MVQKRNPARLVVALSVATVLAIFLVYTALSGQGTPSLQPGELAGHSGRVSLVGKVVGRPQGNAHDAALRFTLRDRAGTATVPVVYHGTVPDLFKADREVVVDGTLVSGTFVAVPNSLVTKCPSKFAPVDKSHSAAAAIRLTLMT